MRHHALSLSAMLIVLTACGDSAAPKGDDRGAAATAAAAGELKPIEPGEYENSISITRFELPGLPPEMLADVRSQMEQAMAVQTRVCISAEEAAGGREERMRKLAQGNGDCRVAAINVDGDAIEGQMTCNTANGANGTMTFTGTMGATASDVNIATEMTEAGKPEATAKIDMRVISRRIGDCPAGAGTTP